MTRTKPRYPRILVLVVVLAGLAALLGWLDSAKWLAWRLPIDTGDGQQAELLPLADRLLHVDGHRGELEQRLAFRYQYDERHELSAWVAYCLRAEHLAVRGERHSGFSPDPLVSTATAAPTVYRYSGWDRGHLLPAADVYWSDSAMRESFYTSNVAPMDPYFNRHGCWRQLESAVRNWARRDSTLLVVAGPALNLGVLGWLSDSLAVPRYYYKVVLDLHPPELKTLAVLLPNSSSCRQPWINYSLSVDSLEQLVELDFFEALPDSQEAALESGDYRRQWLLPGPE